MVVNVSEKPPAGWILTSKNEAWVTPHAMFAFLDAVFHFALDVAAFAHTAKVPGNYFGLDHHDPTRTDALVLRWAEHARGGNLWLNPPYGRTVGRWVRYVGEQADHFADGQVLVLLIFARTDTVWWNKYVHHRAERVHLVTGRLTFLDPVTMEPARDKDGKITPAPAGSALCFYTNKPPGPGGAIYTVGPVGDFLEAADVEVE